MAPHAKEPRPCTSKTAETGVMIGRNDHYQQSPRYRPSSLPKIGEDDVDFGRISTQGSPEKAHYSYSTSVSGMPRGGAERWRREVAPRGGAESGHARSGESKLGRGGAHARHTPPANMTCPDATFKIFPDEKERGGGTIFALDPSGSQDSKYKYSKSPFSNPHVELKSGERTDFPGRIPATARRRRATGPASPYYGGSGVRWDASAPYQELCGTTGHGQPSIVPMQEGTERHAGKWRSIIRWRSAYAVPKMGRIPREAANHQYKRATISCESSEDTPVRTVV